MHEADASGRADAATTSGPLSRRGLGYSTFAGPRASPRSTRRQRFNLVHVPPPILHWQCGTGAHSLKLSSSHASCTVDIHHAAPNIQFHSRSARMPQTVYYLYGLSTAAQAAPQSAHPISAESCHESPKQSTCHQGRMPRSGSNLDGLLILVQSACLLRHPRYKESCHANQRQFVYHLVRMRQM